MRIITVNCNGIRSATSKGLFTWLKQQKADVICFQEIKALESDIPEEAKPWKGWHAFYHSAEKKGYALKAFATDTEKTEAEKKDKEAKEKNALTHYEDAERRQLAEAISGAIYKVTLDKSHPLAFGLKDSYYTLKTNELRYGFLENGWNVGVIKGNAKPIQGFAGHKVNKKLTNSLVLGVEEKGQGNIVYLVDNPLFRSFCPSIR